MKNMVITPALCMLLAVCGCEESEDATQISQPAPPVPPASNAPKQPPDTARQPAVEPEYTLAVEATGSDPKQYSVTWSARVNSGGWKMTVDQVLIENQMGKEVARVYVILEEPGPDEIVTQAFETLTGRHDAGNRKVEKAELSIKRTIRGVDQGFTTYNVVKQI